MHILTLTFYNNTTTGIVTLPSSMPTPSPISASTPVSKTLAGSGASGYMDGTGTVASFNQLHGIAVDSVGTVYIADTNNNRVRMVLGKLSFIYTCI
jgi:hypothetical protein